MVWTLGTFSVTAYIAIGVFYLLRQRRNCYDLTEGKNSLKNNNPVCLVFHLGDIAMIGKHADCIMLNPIRFFNVFSYNFLIKVE